MRNFILSLSFMFCVCEGDDVGYSISKVKDLPKLHRAVWKCNMHKVKTATKGIKTSELNAFDKGRRYVT